MVKKNDLLNLSREKLGNPSYVPLSAALMTPDDEDSPYPVVVGFFGQVPPAPGDPGRSSRPFSRDSIEWPRRSSIVYSKRGKAVYHSITALPRFAAVGPQPRTRHETYHGKKSVRKFAGATDQG